MRSKLFESSVTFFLIAIVPFLIFLATYGVFYFTIGTWVDNPARHFGEIKATLDSYGDLTDEERDQIENHSITLSTANKAVAVARPDFFDSLVSALLPIGAITAIYYVVRLAFKRKMSKIDTMQEDRLSRNSPDEGHSSSNRRPPSLCLSS